MGGAVLVFLGEKIAMRINARDVVGGTLVVGLVAMGSVDVAQAAPPPLCFPLPCDPVPDGPNAFDSETENNDFFSFRNVFAGSDRCRWDRELFARLGPVDTGNPDTVVGIICAPIAASEESSSIEAVALDTSEEAEARAMEARFGSGATPEGGGDDRGFVQNDDGGRWARWGGSQLLFVNCAGLVFDLIVTGKGCDPFFDTAPCNHNQSGLYEVQINYFGNMGQTFIGSECFRSTLSGTDIDRFTRNAPAGTFDFDVFVNPLAEYHGDADYYEITGLRPGEEYIVTTKGLSAREQERTLDTIIVAFSSSGLIINSNDDIGEVGLAPNTWWNRNSRLNIQADANGRIFFAVTGFNDFDADRLQDPEDICLHTETGAYLLRIRHRCDIGCLDLDGSCQVDFGDITVLLGNWLRTCQ